MEMIYDVDVDVDVDVSGMHSDWHFWRFCTNHVVTFGRNVDRTERTSWGPRDAWHYCTTTSFDVVDI
jgi:hypothetical protein